MFSLILLACLALSLACVLYPIYVIRPFRAQGARELAAALVVSRYRGMVTVIAAIAALAALAAYWPSQPVRWRRFSPRRLRASFVYSQCWRESTYSS